MPRRLSSEEVARILITHAFRWSPERAAIKNIGIRPAAPPLSLQTGAKFLREQLDQ